MTNTTKVVEFTHPALVFSALRAARNGSIPGPALELTFGELLEAGLAESLRPGPGVRLTAAGKARLKAATEAANAVAGALVEVPES